MTDLYDAVILREVRVREYTYSPMRRAVQRVKAMLAAVVPGALGFDVSVWQAFVDFSLAKAAGLTWVYIRALYGLIVDGKFPVHFPAARGVMPRTAYLYYRDYETPKTQAQKLYDTCLAQGDPGDFMPVLDLETIGNPTLTASRVKTCLEELAWLFGKTPIIYSGYYVIRDALKGDKTFLSAYMLIIAAYPFAGWTDDLPQKVLQYPPLIPAPFVMWTANADEPLIGRVVGWQFTASAPAGQFGVSGNYLDLDWCSPAFAKQVLQAGPPVDPPPGPGDPQMQFINTGNDNSNIRTDHVVSVPSAANAIGSLPPNAIVTALEMFIGSGYVWVKYAVEPGWLLPGKTGATGWSALVKTGGNPLIDFHAAVPCGEGVPMTEEELQRLAAVEALTATHETEINALQDNPPAEFVPSHRVVTTRPNGEKLKATPSGNEAVQVYHGQLLMMLNQTRGGQELMATQKGGVTITGWLDPANIGAL